MTLGRRLTVHLTLLLLGLLLTASVAIWGMLGLRQDFSIALDHYERLRQLYQVGFHLQSARLALALNFPDPPRARLESRRALQMFERQEGELAIDPQLKQQAAASLERAVDAMQGARPVVNDLDAPLGRLNDVVDALRDQITAAQRSGDRHQQRTVLLVAIVAAATVLTSLFIGRRQFIAVMRPLSTLGKGVKRIAAGEFDQPLQLMHADDEFVMLATDFNQMAEQLREIYLQLHERIDAATRNLVQSERLAGVGLLAAGVAHEINNPLSIITGRIELMLRRPIEPAVDPQLRVVLEEAFRCKQIIDRLLRLSRGATGQRSAIRLDDVVNEVVSAVRAMTTVRDRHFEIETDGVTIRADEGEVRQVVLNLLINAIQFTQDTGRIDISVTQDYGRGVFAVKDDGQGIATGDLSKLFDPFYSTPHGERRGTGLGLAISKAIIEAHGGQIDAYSDGPRKGSRFVVRWPMAEDGSR